MKKSSNGFKTANGHLPLFYSVSEPRFILSQKNVLVESMAYLLLFLSFCCFEEEFTFDAFQESPTAKERLDLTKIKTSMAGRSSFDLDSSAAAKKLHQKMARKYGHLSHTTDWGSGKKCWPFV